MKKRSIDDDATLALLTDISFAQAPAIATRSQARELRKLVASLFGRSSGASAEKGRQDAPSAH
ncbi:MAG: hypothetical protein KDK91_19190 [Gammaproteobacteria bacterium]|nr:hypothetical protein [Gammaproteobacteria bacterium]